MNTTDEDVSIVDLCKWSGCSRKEANATLKRLGVKPIKIAGKLHVEAEEASCVFKELGLPKELTPKRAKASFVRDAPNPRRVYATVDGYPGKHTVIIPRHMKPRVIGKRFAVEVIEDEKGVTFRHEWFGKVRSLKS